MRFFLLFALFLVSSRAEGDWYADTSCDDASSGYDDCSQFCGCYSCLRPGNDTYSARFLTCTTGYDDDPCPADSSAFLNSDLEPVYCAKQEERGLIFGILVSVCVGGVVLAMFCACIHSAYKRISARCRGYEPV